jgi:hypothetical protein
MANPELTPTVPMPNGLPPFVRLTRHQGLRRMNCCGRSNCAALEHLTASCAVVLAEESWPVGMLVEVTIPLVSGTDEQSGRWVTVVGNVTESHRLPRREALTLQGPKGLLRPALRLTVQFLTTDEELTHWVGGKACADLRPPRCATEHPDLRPV